MPSLASLGFWTSSSFRFSSDTCGCCWTLSPAGVGMNCNVTMQRVVAEVGMLCMGGGGRVFPAAWRCTLVLSMNGVQETSTCRPPATWTTADSGTTAGAPLHSTAQKPCLTQLVARTWECVCCVPRISLALNSLQSPKSCGSAALSSSGAACTRELLCLLYLLLQLWPWAQLLLWCVFGAQGCVAKPRHGGLCI